jgi:hypothetical protein
MSYSELLARQEQALNQLNEQYFVDHTAIKKLQEGYHDKAFYAGELERLQAAYARNLKETQERFSQERRTYLNEPEPAPDISASQDKAVTMLDEYRQRQQQQATPQQTNPNTPTQKPMGYTADKPAKAHEPDDEALKRMMEDTRRRREGWKHRRGGYKR